ncbi:Saccharopine dehydrogenase isoform 2 [Cinnamomum micranthum f. kanehirae]|uniref:Saccharopine dehydrogenase isoform 2 n=1 Tax=Cinnamomum micranthum f. kanehirae TaxID=337451 RepID=A0A3S3N8H9_9MAGN|nr:Saccharopine dehydrogenase isoform 2 [Cinnamomum micranthum f. kanehirae]
MRHATSKTKAIKGEEDRAKTEKKKKQKKIEKMAPSFSSFHLNRWIFSCVKTAGIEGRDLLPNNPKLKSTVLILGGTGRVGGSTATALSKLCPDLRILVAGRNRSCLDAQLCFCFQVELGSNTAYVDVCDDTSYAWRAKSFHKEAVAANVPAITTGGIYPGVSNVMAAELVHLARNESEDEPERLRFFYYTAGSGGAGPTILATSFLLLGEDVIAYNKGEKIKLRPYSGMLNIDFGKGIGKRDVYLLNLPEVMSAHEVLGVPTVSARFGTSPFFWNWGMEIMANFVPGEFLRDRSKVQQLVQIFDPFVRAFDGIAGERMSMRVDLDCSNGRNTVGIFSHRRLSVSVGTAIAAFAAAILEGSTQPGVWFPEEPEGIAVEARELLLERASQGTINFVMNKPPWMVETDPKELGLGIYV